MKATIAVLLTGSMLLSTSNAQARPENEREFLTNKKVGDWRQGIKAYRGQNLAEASIIAREMCRDAVDRDAKECELFQIRTIEKSIKVENRLGVAEIHCSDNPCGCCPNCE